MRAVTCMHVLIMSFIQTNTKLIQVLPNQRLQHILVKLSFLGSLLSESLKFYASIVASCARHHTTNHRCCSSTQCSSWTTLPPIILILSVPLMQSPYTILL